MSGAYSRSSGLVQRRTTAVTTATAEISGDELDEKLNGEVEEDHDSKETRLTLMEEVLLLGLKDREVRAHFTHAACLTFFWPTLKRSLLM